jgi:hypothetical protein
MTVEDPVTSEVRRRQRGRSLIMALALGAFAILLFLITIARIGSLS